MPDVCKVLELRRPMTSRRSEKYVEKLREDNLLPASDSTKGLVTYGGMYMGEQAFGLWFTANAPLNPPDVYRFAVTRNLHSSEAALRDAHAQIANLTVRVEHLEACQAKRRLWRLGELRQQLAERGEVIGRGRDEIERLQGLLLRLHRVSLNAGLDCMPPPQVDTDGEDFELTWLNVRRRRSIALGIDEGQVALSWLEDARSDEALSPSDELIAMRLGWVIGETGE